MKRFLVIVMLLFGMVGCADSSASSAPPVCDSWAAMENTVYHMRTVNVSENGLSALAPYLNQLKAQINQLYLDAKANFAPQAEALKAAAEKLGDDLRTARENPDRTTLAAVRGSVGEVRASADGLHTAMASTC
jgi:hypothetical protein